RQISTLSLHDALPIYMRLARAVSATGAWARAGTATLIAHTNNIMMWRMSLNVLRWLAQVVPAARARVLWRSHGRVNATYVSLDVDRKSTRLNSSHRTI